MKKQILKKQLAILCLFALLAGLFGCTAEPGPSGTAAPTEAPTEAPDLSKWHVAMISYYGTAADGGFQQDVFEAAEAWCRDSGVAFSVYETRDDSCDDRIRMIEQAVQEGANVLLLPDYTFAEPIVETVEKYPELYYIAPCVTADDLKSVIDPFGDAVYDCPANLYCPNYREEVAGYLAGWAAVAGGSGKLGILCSFPVAAHLRLCYGFLQGADAAAAALGRTAEVEARCALFGSFTVDEARVRATLDDWYAAGTEQFFVIGEPAFLDFAAKELAADGKPVVVADGLYRPQLDETAAAAVALCARADYGVEVRRVLTDLIVNENWSAYSGTVARIGITSEDPAQNGLGLAAPLQAGDGFTKADYAALVGALCRGELTVSDEIDQEPAVRITVIEGAASR